MRLRVCTGGFLRPGLTRALAIAGHEVALGWPGPGEAVAVWGASPRAWRGEWLAQRSGAPLWRIEDAFLRSLRPGRSGDAPLGLLIDDLGLHHDATRPSRLETILAGDPFDDGAILAEAREAMARIRHLDLSKYNLHDPALPLPAPGYVLVVDQLRGDASVRDPAAFARMLAEARADHPKARILIKTHPETMLGHRRGHFTPKDGICLSEPLSPRGLLEGAIAVYTVSSQLGFEAILAGHRPKVYGQPFYAGWGLTEDMDPPPRRGRRLTPTQLFAGAMILAPNWSSPSFERPLRLGEVIDQLEAEVRVWREDRAGYVAGGMRLWKRRHLQDFFGQHRALRFGGAARAGRKALVWGRAEGGAAGVEDGFLRSRGLGAELTPPLSLILDRRGIYYDPTRPSDLEALITAPLPPGGAARAEAFLEAILRRGVTKYNLGGESPALPEGHRILVPGQVEDDASLRFGAGEVRDNRALLEAVRAAYPEAIVVYKPHPDVEAGLRPGAIAAEGLADVVALGADPLALIAACDEVWTMTSTLGFEALLRGKRVTVLGAPFYAGWGLTRDLGPIPQRRLRAEDGHPQPRVSLAGLVHATLIAYPRYIDPKTRRPCPPEVALERLSHEMPGRAALRLLAKLQGLVASQAHLWR
jgi:capsular polysaccharide export protein